MSRIMYDTKMYINCKDKIFTTITKPAMESGSEMMGVKEKDTTPHHRDENAEMG